MVSSEYYSYLLRMWQVPDDGHLAWRVLLENIQTGEKHGFSCLEELMAFLGQDISSENNLVGEDG